ncbi:MAG: hypothetical protein ACJASG_000573 [Oleiphilaceae bacterium]|jgi:hypothetical protein
MNMNVIMRFTGALITTVIVVQTGISEAGTKLNHKLVGV